MIGYLCGKIIVIEDNTLLIDVQGVGYTVIVSMLFSRAVKAGMTTELYVQTIIRDDALDLFGFQTLWEKKVFQMLTSVSGVGPRTGIAILSGLNPKVVLSSIVREDRATLGSISGVGKKTVERLILELREKAQKLLTETSSQQQEVTNLESVIPPQGASFFDEMWGEVLAALLSLGYRESEAIMAVRAASSKLSQSAKPITLEILFRTSLQNMPRRT